MTALDELFAPKHAAPNAFGDPQCFDAEVVATGSRGAYVVIPNYDRSLTWGPCLPATAAVAIGDHVSVALSELGEPWLIGVGADGARETDPNVDGGYPGDTYGGDLPDIDGGAP